MAPAKPKPAAKHSYHHGDLRRALIEAAWLILARGGIEALTLREVAREVGVTHAAPYHHFPTRASLIDALTEQAFVELSAAMDAALANAPDDPIKRMNSVGRGYVDFAHANPNKLQLIFRRRNEELEGPRTDTLIEAGNHAFAQLFDTVAWMQKHHLAPKGDTHELALYAWSVVHGFCKLWIEGPLATMPPYGSRYEAMREAMLCGITDGWKAQSKQKR